MPASLLKALARRALATGQRPPARSRGAALILFVLFLVAIGSGVLINAVQNSTRAPVTGDDQTGRSLAEAKAALLAWAVSHPGVPGQLPFPDRGADSEGFDGLSDCNAAGAVSAALLLGQFPWRGDDAPGSGCLSAISSWSMSGELRDASGQRLWYAVSDKLVHKESAHFTAINPGLIDDPTAGGSWITVRDATGALISDQIAAVIIAPGKAIGNQDRGSVAISDALYPAQFLDSVTVGGTTYSNANPSGTFIIYPHSDTTASTTDAFNDRLVYITAGELLRATERRVLGEVAVALRAYREANGPDGGYPWLSPFRDPLSTLPADVAARFDGVPGTRIGHLAFTEPADTGTQILDTGFNVTWSNGGVSALVVGTDTFIDPPYTIGSFAISNPDLMLLGNSARVAAESGMASFAMPTTPTGADTSCLWQGDNSIVECKATRTQSNLYQVSLYKLNWDAMAGYYWVLVGPASVDRDYVFDINYTGDPTEPSPSPSGARVRDVGNRGVAADSGTTSTITVKDYINGHPVISATRRLTITDDGSSTATVDLSGIYVEPVIDGTRPGDLPAWFFDNDWPRYVLVKYASNALPAEGWAASGSSPCTVGADCLEINVETIDAVRDDVRAVVIGAGWQLAGQDRSGTGLIDDYFEDENSDDPPSLEAQRRARAVDFNDQIRIVE